MPSAKPGGRPRTTDLGEMMNAVLQAKVLADEKQGTTCAFTARAIAWFERYSMTVARLLSDNGSAYRSQAFRQLLTARGFRHIRTRP